MSRWNSPILRTALIMLIIFAIKEYYKVEVPNELVENIINAIFVIIFGIGAINNPTDRNKM